VVVEDQESVGADCELWEVRGWDGHDHGGVLRCQLGAGGVIC